MLDRKTVLIVEGDALVGLDLAVSVAEVGGTVLGPVPTVREALALIATQQIDAAILDVTLRDRDVTPVARMLRERNAAVVIHSGTVPSPEVIALWPALPVFAKPADTRILIRKLEELVANAAVAK